MYLERQNIFFLDNSFSHLLEYFKNKKHSKTVVLVDENSYKYCYPLFSILPVHHVIEIKSGEDQKNIETAIKIWHELTVQELDRKALLINIGGGVIGDMGGFCAATYKRGIDFIQVPTTLLSMVDASVGGKLGIDFEGYKNHIGVFNQPDAVFVFPGFIKSLPKKEVRSGFAEIIKHCLIRDVQKFRELQNITVQQIEDKDFNWSPWIRHSIEIKARIVDEDPKEAGIRKILNFGHTIGHAIETYFLNTKERLLHGEAIAIGMITESYLGLKLQKISKDEFDDIKNYIIGIFGKVNITPAQIKEIVPLVVQDKKNSFGKVKIASLNGIGNCYYDVETSIADIEDAMLFYTNLKTN
jgi:3-dehydroquinate synthase